MIKIISGYTGPGGSTVSFSNLTNLFNDNGLETCFYGPHVWDGIKCNFGTLDKFQPTEDDIVIYHYLKVTSDLPCKKAILSCHETGLFKIKEMAGLHYDAAHFVSTFQKDWQGVEGTVIPNVLTKIQKNSKEGKPRVAGIIGSIDENKCVPMSVKRALADGHDDIRIYGSATQPNYFFQQIIPLLSNKVSYRGVADDMQEIYDTLTDVYHSPRLETYNLIKPECEAAGVIYHGDEGNDTQAEYWDDQRIFEAWKNLLLV